MSLMMRGARARVELRALRMKQTLGGPAIVLALVLGETAVGGLAVLWLSDAWGRTRMGFFKLIGAVLASMAILAWLAARAPLLNGPTTSNAARAGVALLMSFAIATVLWQVLLWAGARAPSRIVGIAAVPIGIAALVTIAFDPAAASKPASAAFQLLAGALFAGAVTDGLLLGHWYLVERKLTRAPLARMNTLFLAGCVVAIVGAILGRHPGTATVQLSPLLGAGALAAYLAVGLAALCVMIGFFIRALVKEDSIQAATGLFYLAVILALAAEFAAKVRFF
ncbi:MAG TPA: hypothetical protein VKV69_10445 [Actinomycetota bacterium]|nr:hypothetical protein [Actinomycetota bacterium]